MKEDIKYLTKIANLKTENSVDFGEDDQPIPESVIIAIKALGIIGKLQEELAAAHSLNFPKKTNNSD